MKLKIRRKASELHAEQFNPPLQIPEGVINVCQTLHSGFMGEIRLTPDSAITQVLHSGDVIIYFENGFRKALDKKEFEQLYDIIGEA